MPIIQINNRDWTNDPVKVNTFLATIDMCLDKMPKDEHRARVQDMRNWVAEHRVFSIKQESWLQKLKWKLAVEDTDAVDDFWSEIFTTIN